MTSPHVFMRSVLSFDVAPDESWTFTRRTHLITLQPCYLPMRIMILRNRFVNLRRSAVRGEQNVDPRSIFRREIGHAIPAMGWLRYTPNLSR